MVTILFTVLLKVQSSLPKSTLQSGLWHNCFHSLHSYKIILLSKNHKRTNTTNLHISKVTLSQICCTSMNTLNSQRKNGLINYQTLNKYKILKLIFLTIKINQQFLQFSFTVYFVQKTQIK
jgi:hypothetical protein